jgi:hypothetical protein
MRHDADHPGAHAAHAHAAADALVGVIGPRLAERRTRAAAAEPGQPRRGSSPRAWRTGIIRDLDSLVEIAPN